MIAHIIAQESYRNRAFVEREFAKLPSRFKPKAAASYARLYARPVGGFRAANLELLRVLDVLGGSSVNLASDEKQLRDFAEARALECSRVGQIVNRRGAVMRLQFRRMVYGYDANKVKKSAGETLHLIRNVALRYGIQPPNEVKKTSDGAEYCCVTYTAKGMGARLLDAGWWRRAVRRYVAQRVEGAAIKLGMVWRGSEIYASEESCNRRRGQKIRNRAMLESMIAVNDQGQEYTLQELSDLGVSNPKIRRMELMTRLAGFDLVAQAAGHAADFYTLTAPSKYHAVEYNGKANPKYNKATPRETQSYLCRVWARVRAALHRREIGIYGFRVCEPHHDGTPHWHMVVFMQPEHNEAVRAIFRRYALEEDGDEKGADVHRFKFEAINRKRGTAAGYLAKYISKNIDGHGVDVETEESGGAVDAQAGAKRVDAWASTWRIRQFQQIGGAPVTVWRELRRLKPGDAEGDLLLARLIEAADAGDWKTYINLQGGAFTKRADLTAKLWRRGSLDMETGEIRLNKYGEPAADTIRGVDVWGLQTPTRLHEWFLKRGAVFAPSWSSVNNCTGDFENDEREGGAASREGAANGSFHDAERGQDYFERNGGAFGSDGVGDRRFEEGGGW